MLPTCDAVDETQPVLCWREGAIARLQLNRPAALNALDVPTAQAFHAACRRIAGDSAVRAVGLSGAGRAFCAGGDVASMNADPVAIGRQLIDAMHGALLLLAQLDAPVVASVQGAAAGAGLGLVLGCDLAIAAEGARFTVAYPAIGASADCSTTWGLPRVVGVRRAMELALLSDTLDAQQALQLGLVNQVVPAAELADRSDALLRRLAAGPTRALGQLKRLVRSSLDHDLQQHLDAEAQGFLACAATQDFREGTAAFLQKRRAEFGGR